MIQLSLYLSSIVLVTGTVFSQGSLNPPGAPGPTMKTLGQIEPRIPIESLPFRITNQGSYYMTGNLLIPPAQAGITIETNNVTLDLAGFTIRGFPTSLQGILLSGSLSHVTVQNGGITGASAGIDGTASTRVQVRNIRASDCRGTGISLGNESLLENCQANQNLGSGVKTGAESQILNCQGNGNIQNGIETGNSSILRDCSANKNTGSGIVAGDGTKLSFVTANENAIDGIAGGTGVNISDSTAQANKTDGIGLTIAGLITRTSVSYNLRYGIIVQTWGSIGECYAVGNGWIGIAAGENAQIFNSKADGNAGGGFAAQRGSTIRDSSANKNTFDGIAVTKECTVIRNTCNGNVDFIMAAGIHALGTDNVIQENTVISNDRGIAVDVEGNMIVKNTLNNNTLNLYTTGDQTLGPVVTVLDPNVPNDPLSNYIF
jgi:parallel beta-helix repeat protein